MQQLRAHANDLAMSHDRSTVILQKILHGEIEQVILLEILQVKLQEILQVKLQEILQVILQEILHGLQACRAHHNCVPGCGMRWHG